MQPENLSFTVLQQRLLYENMLSPDPQHLELLESYF